MELRDDRVSFFVRALARGKHSVAYRLQRVQAIASLDLEQAEDRLQAQVALKILSGAP